MSVKRRSHTCSCVCCALIKLNLYLGCRDLKNATKQRKQLSDKQNRMQHHIRADPGLVLVSSGEPFFNFKWQAVFPCDTVKESSLEKPISFLSSADSFWPPQVLARIIPSQSQPQTKDIIVLSFSRKRSSLSLKIHVIFSLGLFIYFFFFYPIFYECVLPE